MASRRRDDRESSGFGRKLFGLLVIAGLIYWAGRDPAGAAMVTRHIGEGIASFVHGVAQHANKHP